MKESKASSHNVFNSYLVNKLIHKVSLINECENVIIEKYIDDDMKTPMHMSRGDENCVVGVTEALLGESYFFGYYRTHSLYLSVTNDPFSFFAEMLGKETGSNKGLSGSMHLSSPEVGLLSTSAIVASTIPLSLGAALAAKKSNKFNFSVVFFGDGAIEEGVFHETLNMACVFNLPIIFVCLDNGLAVDVEAKYRQGFKSIKQLVSSYNCKYLTFTKPDVFEAYNLALNAKKIIVKENIPVFLHMKHYRYLQHIGVSTDFEETKSQFEKEDYRSKIEHEKQLKNLPLEQTIKAALELGYKKEKTTEIIMNTSEIALSSYNKALESSFIDPLQLDNFVFKIG